MIIAVITSRWKSKRLPGKALKRIQGKPLIRHIVDRARESKVDEVIVATTLSSPSIISYCINNQIPYYAYQDDWNVLGRLLAVADAYKADTLVYLWGDCPFIEPTLIDAALDYFKITKKYFFDMNIPAAIVPVEVLREYSKKDLSKHKREYIHDYILRNIKPTIEINTLDDLRRANEIL